jgi:hypothetical protein
MTPLRIPVKWSTDSAVCGAASERSSGYAHDLTLITESSARGRARLGIEGPTLGGSVRGGSNATKLKKI